MGMGTGWHRHPVAAGIVGVFAGAVTIMLVEWAGHQWLGDGTPPKPGAISASMFASVLVAWVLGAAAAGLVGTAWAGGRSLWPGLAAAAFLLAGSVMTMFAFPHPVWMVVAAPLLMPAAAWLAARSRLQR
jgi:hypothetical protein